MSSAEHQQAGEDQLHQLEQVLTAETLVERLHDREQLMLIEDSLVEEKALIPGWFIRQRDTNS